jgi:hypothetical protein
MALLTSLTTLHIAIKLHESKKIKLSTLANLSRGQFGPKDIELMEWKVLAAVGWRLHPPTHYAFVTNLLLFLPQEVNSTARKGLNELAKYVTELAVCDSYFVDVHNSIISFAAILNVMEDTNYSRLSGGLREKFLSTLNHHVGLHHFADDVVNARQRLRKMFAFSSATDGTVFAPHQACRGQENVGDNGSLAERSISSTGSVGSVSYQTRSANSYRSRTNSFDSKGSCRYSPSPRRSFLASVSPMACSSRAAISSSPIVAGVQ